MIRLALAFVVTLLAIPAQAQMAQNCDWIARADGIVEPWEDNTRTFANGKVRVALLDAVEPGSWPLHLLLLSPPYNELGERQCVTIGMSENLGFGDLNFKSLDASYDPAKGLMFQVNVKVLEGEVYAPKTLHFTLNQSTGAVDVSLR